MKKTLLLFIGCVQFFGTIAKETNIVNRDFETWNDKTFEHLIGLRDAMEEQIEHTFPDSIVLSKSSDAKEGSYSLRMDTKYDGSSDTTSGYFIVGAWGDQGPSGGVPFTLQADSLVGWYKYDVMPGDTAWIILNLKNAGSTIAGGQYAITGSHSTWKRFAFATNYGAGSVDTLFLAATCSNIINDDGFALPGSWLMLDDVNLVTKAGASASFNNATFESWTDTVVSNIADWYTVNLTMKKTSNAYSGNSAVELEVKEITHDDGKKEKIGAIVANYDFHNSSGGGTHFTATPIKLEGYWDYSPAINDTGWVSIEFFKNGTRVGGSGYQIANTTNGYQKFSLDLSVTEKPDTFKVSLYAGDSIGTKMLVDDLNLISDVTVGVEQQVSYTGNVFPNPTTDLLHVGNAHSYSVSNVIGVLLGQGRVKASVISLAGFRKGVYVLTLRNSNGESIHTQKIVKK